MKRKRRNYPGSDSYMLETSSTLHALFLDSIADFTALDSTLDAAYATDWKAKIDAAYSLVQHNQVKDIAAEKTEVVQAIMEQCRLKYNEVKFFASKVYKDSEAKQDQFGLDTYQKVRASHSAMIGFMDNMHKACVAHQADLLAAGMSQTSIDEILTLRDNILNANTKQEQYFKQARIMTQERIDVLNQCYNSTRTVIDAAMVIYYNDYARRNNFVYSPSTSDNDDVAYINQAILDDSPIHIYTIDYVAERIFVLYNEGPAKVDFYLADTEDTATNKVSLSAGERFTVKADQLGDNGSNLYVVLDPATGATADVEVEVSLEV